MKELFERFDRVGLDSSGLVLVDTCFFISVFEDERVEEFSKLRDKAMTGFNVLELLRVEHRLHHHKHEVRKFLKGAEMKILEIDVEPGDVTAEKRFVSSVDPELLLHCKDASDAVLLAAAIKTGSIVLTKDKHHLFNSDLSNFLEKYDVKVYKELKDVI